MDYATTLAACEELPGFETAYEASFADLGEAALLLIRLGGWDKLAAVGRGRAVETLTGEQVGQVKCCPLSHENRLALGRLLPHTKPVSLRDADRTFGFGDRLGLANEAQLAAISETGAKPVLAQQSMRELSLTSRTYADVLDNAAWAVFKAGWKGGYGADGDHLKSKEDIAGALGDGFTMITLDCSEALAPLPETAAGLEAGYAGIPPEERQRYESRYLDSAEAEALGAPIGREALMAAAVVYRGAVRFAAEVFHELISRAEQQVDFEISIDETASTTDPAAHYFVARELLDAGVEIRSMAPRFVGEFQKGIDYIGDLDAFARDIEVHCRIADALGYKISIHSGSDKFSIFPAAAKAARGRFHIKTSGTSWLEAVRVIAQKEPELYREMHRFAMTRFAECRAYYVVHADPAKVKPLDSTRDEELPGYLDADDSRQLLHITYGPMLEDPVLGDRIFSALHRHRAAYDAGIKAHMLRHLRALDC